MTFAAGFARDRPDEIALSDPGRAWSWAEVDKRVGRAAAALQQLDLGPDRRVAVIARNSADTVIAYVACTLAGASAVAVNSHLTAAETSFILNDSRAAAVLCDSATAEVALAAANEAGVNTVVAWGDGPIPPGVASWAELCREPAEPDTAVTPRRTLVYTSGTTGRPKGVELPMTSWVGGADVAEHVARLAESSLVAHGRHLVVGPLYHSGPLTATRLLIGGAPVSVLGKFDAEALLTTIERDRIGSSIMVPTHFQRLLALPEERRAAADVSSLRFVLQVGAKCPEPVKRAVIEWWGDVVWESYGASEVGTTCMISAAEWLQRPGSVGRAVPPFEAYILGDDGRPAAPGTEGPLWFRDSAGNGIRYITGMATGEDFTLGEIGRMDEEGYVWITDRFADMVVSGGVNIYPAEVEQALINHPGIEDVACFGVPDDEMGERLVAMIVPVDLTDPPSVADLDQFARQRLAGFKVPREVVVATTLPRNPVGKLDKRAMRAMSRDEHVSAAGRRERTTA